MFITAHMSDIFMYTGSGQCVTSVAAVARGWEQLLLANYWLFMQSAVATQPRLWPWKGQRLQEAHQISSDSAVSRYSGVFLS